jgi:hypothetical protein
MPGNVNFKYDPEQGIVFSEDHWEIKTRQDVDDFFAEYRKYFQNIGEKVYMISNIDDLRVYAQIANYYGQVANKTAADYLLGLARYSTNEWARMTVRTTSLKVKMEPNIYSSREEALKVIEKMKQKESDAQPDGEGTQH